MFDALYPDAADTVLKDRAATGMAPVTPGAFDNFWSAARNALPAAVLESTRAISPVLDAFGKSAAFAQGGSQAETIDRMGDNDLSPLLAREIKKISPDPQTSGTASQIVFGVSKLVGKAVGYGVVAGPAGAIVGTGLDEGINETMRLQDKGVDTGTAAKAGAVHGILTAGSIALPVAGKTLAQTAGLALAGGPASFMAENAAIGAILERSGYGAVAKEYDPFDAVGLTVATLAPLMFGAGAHALRAKAAKVGAGDTATPEVLRPEINPDAEAAARTLQTAQHVEAVSLAPRDDFAARNAHADALETAGKAIDAGRAVALDALPLDSAKASAALARMQEAAPAIEARAALHPSPESISPDTATHPASAAVQQASEPPDLTLARQIVADNPDLPVFTGARDADGKPTSARGADLLTEAEVDVREANHLRVAFDAAIECFLRNPA